MAAVQGVDLREAEPSPVTKEVCRLVRSYVPFLENDREMRIDVASMNSLIRSGKLLELVASLVPDFE